MHISDGVLSPAVLIGCSALAAACTWLGLRKLDYERLMTTAVISSIFFVASTIHVSVGPSSVHMLMNGLAGVVLGWVAFPCILVALFLQSMLFQFGGITVLGVNTLTVAGPAVMAHYILRGRLGGDTRRAAVVGFLGGFGSVLGTTLLVAAVLTSSDAGFLDTAKLVVLAHMPVMVLEGVVTMFAVGYLKRTKPELLYGFDYEPLARPGGAP
jgi:cobalt/nickel transport system permease protein